MKPHWLLLAALAFLPACDDGGEASSGPTRDADGAGGGAGGTGGSGGAVVDKPAARFELADTPAATPLGHIPFPSDLYRDAAGRLDLSGISDIGLTPIVQSIVHAIEEDTPGFGTSAGFYLAFDGPVAEAALPADATASMADDAGVFVVDVDPDSPEYGRRWPYNWRLEVEETRFLPAHTLKMRLVEGFALRGNTTYAVIATTAVAEASAAFLQTLAPDAPAGVLEAAWQAHAPLRGWLADNPSVTPATAAVFTTQDPTSQLFQARDYMHTLDAPELLEVESRGVIQSRFEVFEGRFRAPRFQEGDIPYTTAGQGKIHFDDNGDPIIQGHEDLRFALSVPLGDMPEGGWPLVLYAHGTGGDYHSFISPRSRVASVLAAEGIAVLGMDQLHHGDRDAGACDGADSACVQLLYFNFQVPIAGRDNQVQSALDLVNLLRFGRSIDFDAETSQTDRAVRIDAGRVMFMGHSQGALNGPLFTAIEPDILGAVFSGGGSQLAITIEQKTEPFDLNLIIKQLAGLSGEELDRFHPAVSLVQTFLEFGDSVNFARYWFAEPPEGHAPKSIFMTIGMQDAYTPAESGMAMAAAGRVPVIEPVAQPIQALDVLGIEPAGIPPYSGNVADGRASAGVAQYPNSGHFTIFEIPSARNRYGNFLRDLSRFDTPVPGIY